MKMGESMEGITVGALIIEGKTKAVYDIPSEPGCCLLISKDRITAGDGAKGHDLEGKAEISTSTVCKIFEFLSTVGIPNHLIRQQSKVSFVARKCHMIPIEWVSRRVATGSFLKRNPGVPEGYQFNPVKRETFFKDDANHDPQWSEEQLINAKLKCGPRTITKTDVKIMSKTATIIFEVLEKAWSALGCQLVDMKIEFGVDEVSGEIVLGDVIDSDSWRLWPGGDKRQMKDKQVYRNMADVTAEGLQQVKLNFRWVADQLDRFIPVSRGRVVVIMGSPTDKAHCESIEKACTKLGVACDLRISSAHKATSDTLDVLAEYEGMIETPIVLIAVAGRSNGLGPVLSGNTALPVLNCPPVNHEWAAQDIWSSLRLPSGLSCPTIIGSEAAALAAASMLALRDHVIWARLRANSLKNWSALLIADAKIREK